MNAWRAQPSVTEANSHIDWPSKGLSRRTPDLSKQACTGHFYVTYRSHAASVQVGHELQLWLRAGLASALL